MDFRQFVLMLAAFSMLFLHAWEPKAVAPKAALDTPEHHVANGNTLLNSGKIDDAYREFHRARELDPKHAPAYLGLGLVYGIKGNYENAIEMLKTAETAKGSSRL